MTTTAAKLSLLPRARFGVREVCAATLFGALVLLAVMDKETQSIRALALWIAVPLAVLLEAFLPRDDDFPTWKRRGAIAAAGTFLTVLSAELLRDVIAAGGSNRREALTAMVAFQAIPLWGVTMWLLAPFLDRAWRALRARNRPDFWSLSCAALALFGFWSFATAMASDRPDRGFRYFGYEIGVLLPLFLVWVRAATSFPALHRTMKTIGLGIAVFALAYGVSMAGLYKFGSEETRAALALDLPEAPASVMKEWVPPHERALFGETMMWRLQAPFGHHNRLGYFSAVCVLLFLLAMPSAAKFQRSILAVGAGLAVLALVCTLGRAAMIALLAGSAVSAILLLGRRALWGLLLLPVLWFAMPDSQRARAISLVNPDTYKRDWSTVALRFQHWEATLSLIADHPVAGTGYGWKAFQYHHERRAEELGLAVGFNHAHNVWLQVAGESGIPGLLFFAAWTGLRWAMLWRLWRATPREDRGRRWLLALWIGVEAAIQFYSLTNLPLRRSLAVLTWFVWAAMTADLIRLSQQTSNEEPLEGRAGP